MPPLAQVLTRIVVVLRGCSVARVEDEEHWMLLLDALQFQWHLETFVNYPARVQGNGTRAGRNLRGQLKAETNTPNFNFSPKLSNPIPLFLSLTFTPLSNR